MLKCTLMKECNFQEDFKLRKVKLFLVFSLTINVLLISLAGLIIFKKGGVKFVVEQLDDLTSNDKKYSDYHMLKKSVFEVVPNKDIVVDKIFIGDSITDYGEYHEYFPSEYVVNRGIRNDTSAGILDRLEQITKINAKDAYLMVGVNDIQHGVKQEVYKNNIAEIINSFQSKPTKLHVLSILPVNNKIFEGTISNEKIIKFNDSLKNLADKYNTDYIDLGKSLSNDNGELLNEYTFDGVHLNGEGYEETIKIIKQQDHTAS